MPSKLGLVLVAKEIRRYVLRKREGELMKNAASEVPGSVVKLIDS